MKRAYVSGLVAFALGCEAQSFETLTKLTVVAVQVSPPSANPGDTVALDLTLFDPEALTLEPGDAGQSDFVEPKIAWFGGCHNPPGESATGCLPLLGEAAKAGVELLAGASPSEVDPAVAEHRISKCKSRRTR